MNAPWMAREQFSLLGLWGSVKGVVSCCTGRVTILKNLVYTVVRWFRGQKGCRGRHIETGAWTRGEGESLRQFTM